MENILIESKNNYIGIVKKITIITFIIAIIGFVLGSVFLNRKTDYFHRRDYISERKSFHYDEDNTDYKEYLLLR